MLQIGNLTFKCASALLARRFVTITGSTDTVAYTAALGTPDGITLADSDNGVVSVQLIRNLNSSWHYDAEDAIALGGNIEVGTNGQGRAETTGVVVGINKEAATVAGSMGTGYNIDVI